MPVPYTFGTRTSAIPLSELDANFNTPVTIGNTTVGLGNTVTTIGNLTLTNVTITSGTINAAVVDSGYVANSVVYANSTGVLTAGSANFVFDGTNVGIGTSSPVGKLNIYGSSGGRYLTLDAPTNGGYATFQAGGTAFADIGSYLAITGSGNATDFFLTTRNYPLIFGSNSTERMRITSAGLVQILSSSTNTTFTGSGELALKNSTSNPYISWHNTAGDRYGYAQASVNSLNIQSESGFLSLGGSSGEAMRINTTGNVSIGTTSNNARLDVRATIGNIYVNSTTGTNQVFLQTANTGGDFYFGIDNSTGGNFNTSTAYAGAIWRSGTNPICFINNSTERMRIASNGDVGIGISSPNAKLEVQSSGTSTSAGGNISGRFSSNGSGYAASIQFSDSVANAAWISMVSADLIFGPATTERMRITSAGNVGIGTTSPGEKLEINSGNLLVGNAVNNYYITAKRTGANASSILIGAYTNEPDIQWTYTGSGALRFTDATASAERMRILSGGTVCINTTAVVVDSTSRLAVSTTTTNGVAAEFSNNTSGTCAVAINNSGAATSTLINWIAAGSYRAAVTWNGTNIIYGTPSDQRLKENIVDSSSALPLINNIKIRSFDFKENGKHIDFGVIAQELVSVVPEAVLKGKDNEDGSIKESWSVDTSTLVPALIKAVQELNAKVAELEAKLK